MITWAQVEWNCGSSYEFGISYANEKGENSSNPGLQVAYQAFWESPLLSGPWSCPEDLGNPLALLDARELQSSYQNRYGLLRLSNGLDLGCHTCKVPEGPTDWIGLYIPSGCLKALFDANLGFHSPQDAWVGLVDEAFVALAEFVYPRSPFDLGLWGEEAGAVCPGLKDITAAELERGGYVISPELCARLSPSKKGHPLPSGLLLYPDTQRTPHLISPVTEASVTAAVEAWVLLLAASNYQAAAAYLTQEANYPWTAEMLQQIIVEYSERARAENPTVTDPHDATGGPSPRHDVRIDSPNPDYIGEIWWDLPISGRWSDLTATFRLKAHQNGAVLILEDLRVM